MFTIQLQASIYKFCEHPPITLTITILPRVMHIHISTGLFYITHLKPLCLLLFEKCLREPPRPLAMAQFCLCTFLRLPFALPRPFHQPNRTFARRVDLPLSCSHLNTRRERSTTSSTLTPDMGDTTRIIDLPPECLQKIARHLWSCSPIGQSNDPAQFRSLRESLYSMSSFSLLSRVAHDSLCSELFAFPCVQTVRQASLLLRSYTFNQSLARHVQGFRLGISHWSRRSKRMPVATTRVTAPETTLESNDDQPWWWWEDSVITVINQIVRSLPAVLNILAIDQSWMHFAAHFQILSQGLRQLQPQELYILRSCTLPEPVGLDSPRDLIASILPGLAANTRLREVRGNIQVETLTEPLSGQPRRHLSSHNWQLGNHQNLSHTYRDSHLRAPQ